MGVLLTIIIPVYNSARYLKRCLTSIENNRGSIPLECIIVDDGSTDDSLEICRSFAAQHEYVTCLRTEHTGVSHARNVALFHSKGRYVLFVDSDDYIPENGISELMDCAMSNNTQFVFADIEKVDFTGEICTSFFNEKSLNLCESGIAEIMYNYLAEPRKNNILSFVWNKLYLREIIEKYSLSFPEELHINEDAAFVFRYISKINNLSYLHAVTYRYCTNQDNIGTGNMADNPFAYELSLHIVTDYLCGCGYMNLEKVTALYYDAYVELGMRNMFHIVRCYNGNDKQLYNIISQMTDDKKFSEGIKNYKKCTDNMPIIPWFIKKKWNWAIIWAFRYQIWRKGLHKS